MLISTGMNEHEKAINDGNDDISKMSELVGEWFYLTYCQVNYSAAILDMIFQVLAYGLWICLVLLPFSQNIRTFGRETLS